MKVIVITAALLLNGCAYNEVTELNRCRETPSCATSVPGSGFGPQHQAATGSTTGQLPRR